MVNHFASLEMLGGVCMSVTNHDNIFLLPKTVDYYQIQLTRMLETEQYSDAVRLLEFLLMCRCDDERLKEEWAALLSWLRTLAPSLVSQPSEQGEHEQEDETEADLLKEHVRHKMAADARYTDHLLQMLKESRSMEKQLLALEQLVYAEGTQVNDVVLQWVQRPQIHPVVRFKGLQVLKQRGCARHIHLRRPEGSFRVRIADTPASFNDFPPTFKEILDLVGQVSGIHDPALHYYAEQTWQEFLAFAYGSEEYLRISNASREEISLWASAFHSMLLRTMYHKDDDSGIRSLYGLEQVTDGRWERTLSFLKRFAAEVFPLK
jgi:hypothetical protein